jgi:hypothetical protein
MIVLAVILWGLSWIALAFAGVAIFAWLSPALGIAGAAAATAALSLVLAAIGWLWLAHRFAQARQNSIVSALASSGAATAVLGLAAKRPVLALGIGGAVAVFLARFLSPPTR